MKKYGKNIGLHIKAVRSYRQQLFMALKLFYLLSSMNLREVMKKYGKNIGLHIKAVRSYSQ